MKNKKWQRLTSLLLVVCMVFGMSVNVFAVTDDTHIKGGKHEIKGCWYVPCETCGEIWLGGHPDDDNDGHCDYCGGWLENHSCEEFYDENYHWNEHDVTKFPHIYNSKDVCKICYYVKGSDVKLPDPTVEETYKITVNPSENGTVTAPAEAKEGDIVALTVSPDEGYELEALSVKGEDGKDVEVTTNYTFTMPASNVTVTATFKEVKQEPVSYGIEFNGSDEGRRNDKKVYVIDNITDDTELTIEDWGYVNIVRPDHKVIAWGNEGTVAVGETVTGADLQAIDKKPYEGRVYLYPVWGPKDYTLHLQGGDYATLPSGKHVAYKTYSATEEVVFTNFDFTREGYTLTSWNNNNHFYNVGDTVSMKQINDDSWKPYADEKVVLSAIWEANNYTVKFDGNGATSGKMADMDFTYDVEQPLTANAYERVEGKNQFKFIGWSTSADGKAVYTDGQSVSNLTTEANGVVTLYAQWEQISTGSTPIGDVTAARYVVEYYKQDSNGQYVKDEAETFMSDAVAIGTEVTAEQKEFDGYKLNEGKSELSGIVSFNSQAEVPFLTLKVYYDALTSFEVSVEWDDDNDRDGKRNDISIPVRLYTGEEAVLNAENGWTASFEDVMAWYEAGNRANTVLLKNERELEETTGYTAGMNRKNSPSIVVTMQHIPEEVSFSGSIDWIDDNNRDGIRPENYVTVKLYKVTTDSYGREWETNVHTVTTGKNSNTEYSFASNNNVTLYKYENGEEIKYVAKVVSVDGYTSESSDPEKVSATHVPETIDISGTINWDDHSNNDGFRPESVTVYLNGGDVSKTVVVNGTDNNVWNYTFEDVYKYYNGEEIEYVVSQDPLSNGYTTSVEGFEITNSRPLDTVNNVQVTLVWDDDNDRDGKRPEANEVTVNLLGKPLQLPALLRWIAGDTQIADSNTPAVNGNAWTYNFDLTDVNGNNKFYNKDEVLFIAELADEKALEDLGYEIIPSVDGTTITLKHIPEEVSFSGEIEWIDDNDRDGIRPENYVTVKLYKVATDSYGREWETNVHTVTTGKNSNTEYSFASNNNVTLYKYENGEEIKYVAKVVSVDGYTSESSDPEKVSATHVPETIDISGTITWDDLNNNDGFRPDAVTVTLKDGDETVNVKDAVSSYNFEKVYKYKNQGQEIEYTVVFEDVEKYEKEQDGYNVVYRHTIERSGAIVTVVWDDDNNRDGVRPEVESIGVELLGKPLESLLPRLLRTILGDEPVVYAESTFSESDANTWVYEFTNANKFFEGKEVIFQTQLTEETLNLLEAKGYNVDIDNNTNTITLSRTPDVYSKVKAEIVWDDDNNRDGIRPENVVIRLFGSNGYSNTYNEKDGNWRHNFSSTAEKPIYVNEPVKNGVVYNVEVRDAVEGYIPTVSGDVDSGFVITMTHMPELIDISGTITWKDGSDYDNIRPDSVVIKLIGDDEEYEETFNSMAGNVWEYEFAGVHKYLNGKEIEYSVSQNKVPGYTTTIKNFDITNIHSPNYPEIEDEPEEKVVVKVKWFNDDSSYRPEEVTVQLYKDGRKYRAAAELSADKDTYENWRYVWEDVNEDEDTEWSIKVNGIPSEYIYEIEQVRSSYFVVNCTLNENEVKKNPETGAF